MQGLIVGNISNLYKIEYEEKIYEAVAKGKFKLENITPVVGDLVNFEITDEASKKAIITRIEDRKTYIKRPKLANITNLIFVISSIDPKPDLLMLDKQLTFAESLNINCTIVLNKIDLDKRQEFEEIYMTYKDIGYKVIKTNARQGEGIQELLNNLEGNINAFAGNSGVGKSTLINSIFNKKITEEGEISKRNKRGKNTTTDTKLYKIDKNTYIADTPGFSSFDISDIESKDLDKYFKEFKQYINNCEFIGCTHIKEESCGIKKAVEEEKISKGRYERYCKIYEELKEKENRKW